LVGRSGKTVFSDRLLSQITRFFLVFVKSFKF